MLSDRLAVCELLLLADEVPGGVRQRGQPRLRHVHLAREAQDDREGRAPLRVRVPRLITANASVPETDGDAVVVLRTLPSLYRFGAKMCSAAKDMGPHYYTGSGEVLSKSAFLDSLSVDVRDKCNRAAGPTAVLMGENHSDPAAHTIEMDILKVGNCSVSSFTPVREVGVKL